MCWILWWAKVRSITTSKSSLIRECLSLFNFIEIFLSIKICPWLKMTYLYAYWTLLPLMDKIIWCKFGYYSSTLWDQEKILKYTFTAKNGRGQILYKTWIVWLNTYKLKDISWEYIGRCSKFDCQVYHKSILIMETLFW